MENSRFRYRYWDSQENEMLYDAVEHCLRCLDRETPDDKDIYNYMTLYDVHNRFIPMLCTGLKDKAQNLIYESDIIRGVFKDGNVKHLIIYSDNNASFHTLQVPYTRFTNSGRFSQEWISEFNYQIIGNIHEHKHLLTTNNN